MAKLCGVGNIGVVWQQPGTAPMHTCTHALTQRCGLKPAGFHHPFIALRCAAGGRWVSWPASCRVRCPRACCSAADPAAEAALTAQQTADTRLLMTGCCWWAGGCRRSEGLRLFM